MTVYMHFFTHLDLLSTYMEVSGHLDAPTALPPGNHRLGLLYGPRAGLEAVAKRKRFLSLLGIELQLFRLIVCCMSWLFR
jgi:hypothetical protein